MSPLIFLVASAPAAPPAAIDVRVPPGFAISTFADNPLAPDIYTLTIDDQGRVIVAGRGYVRVLVDDNGNGVADRAIDLIDGLKDGPMGLLAEGDSLYVVSEGGLQRYRGYNGRDKLRQPPETLVKLKTSGEHDAHMVRRGPDGWLYLLCGNSAGVGKRTITGSRSPVKDPVAGALLRISPDGKEVEVVADGFRNPYSFDFNLEGEPFASDSDNERCVGLPWYEPCRFYHLIPGGNHGWRSPQVGKFWRKPPYFLDCVPPVCYLGRGSPTGVACYRHTHFPERFRGGFFLADWTFGRIDFVPLLATGSSYTGKPEVFAEAVGTSGFAPTGLAVHPMTGELFVSIGGRGTRGGVYRIRHAGSPAGQPLPMAKRSLDWSPEAAKKWLAEARWSGDQQIPESEADLRARRRAFELMLRHRERMAWGEHLTDVVKPGLSHPDRLIRTAAARAARGLAVKVGNVNDFQTRIMLAFVRVEEDPEEAIRVATDVLRLSPNVDKAGLKLQAIRLLQLAYGDLTAPGTAGTIWEGYTLRNPQGRVVPTELMDIVANAYTKSGSDKTFKNEASRTLAAFGWNFARGHYLWNPIWDLSDEATIEDEIHSLAVMARVDSNRDLHDTRRLVDWLLHLDDKIAREWVSRDTNWPLRLEEILEAFSKTNPDLGTELLADPEFGRPEHLQFVKPLSLPPAAAARRFLGAAAIDPNYAWMPGLVRALESLSIRETRPVLEKLWDQAQLRDSIVMLLASEPIVADRPKLVFGLGSFDPGVVRASAQALSKQSSPPSPVDIAAAIKTLRRQAAEDKTTRESVADLLRKWSGETLAADARLWTEWAVRKHPEVQKLLAASDGFDASTWKKREADIPWEKGDVKRGRLVFVKATCSACHDGARALGPSLQGVAKRFSRDDLLTAVLDPSKDVSPRYRPSRLATTDDQVYIGMVIYEATDGVILQTSSDAVVRIAGDKIASRRVVDISLMPTGLLDKLTNPEVADLFAYLRSQ